MNLENRFFYRLVKVMHFFWIFLLTVIIIAILYLKIPSHVPDLARSYILCDNGKNYLLKEADLLVDSNTHTFDDANDYKAKKVCHFGIVLYGLPITDPKLIARLEKESDNRKDKSSEDWAWTHGAVTENKNYILKLVYKPRDWAIFKSILIISFIVFFSAYTTLNIIRETLIYLAFGRKFTWRWLFIFNRTNIADVKKTS